ncbi:D-galacturonate reductase [Yarrowia sp. B02]|nr:D-galacturonate reductase [Yarrowia sp. B02]
MISETFKLNDGHSMPALGLGTASDDNVEQVTYTAIKNGYRHIDTAFIYQSEKAIGKGIQRAISDGLVTREELFVTTKVWPTFHDRVSESLDASLADLGLEYVDLLLLHWPAAMDYDASNKHAYETRFTDANDWIATYVLMEAEKAAGRTKSIGVCNVSETNLKKLLKQAKTVPAVNQFEIHPYLPQKQEVAFNESLGILVTAYSPLGSSTGQVRLHENAVVEEIAKKHGTATASVLVNWHVSQGRAVLPKTTSEVRVKSNAQKVHLDEDDLKRLDKIWETIGTHRAIGLAWMDKDGDHLGYPEDDVEFVWSK